MLEELPIGLWNAIALLVHSGLSDNWYADQFLEGAPTGEQSARPTIAELDRRALPYLRQRMARQNMQGSARVRALFAAVQMSDAERGGWDDEVFIRQHTTGSVRYAALWGNGGNCCCDTAGFQLHVELVHTHTGHQQCICRLQRGVQRRAIQQCSGLDHGAFQRTRRDLIRIRGSVFVEASRIVTEAIHVGCDGQGFRPNNDRKLGEGRHRFRGHCLQGHARSVGSGACEAHR